VCDKWKNEDFWREGAKKGTKAQRHKGAGHDEPLGGQDAGDTAAGTPAIPRVSGTGEAGDRAGLQHFKLNCSHIQPERLTDYSPGLSELASETLGIQGICHRPAGAGEVATVLFDML
jgi:hypothetical protein